MKFGTKFAEAARGVGPNGGSGKWIRTLKEGETRMRFLEEMDNWLVYYEHYNPIGSAFPCTGDKATCPGCTSDNERMNKASRKVAVNAIVGQYQDVYKLPITLVNRLKIKSERNDNTITDRDYIITRIGKSIDTEYDVESGNALPIDLNAFELANVQTMLEVSFSENWPDFTADQILKEEKPKEKKKVGATIDAYTNPPAAKEGDSPAPFEAGTGGEVIQQSAAVSGKNSSEEVEITLEQLHGMTPDQLRKLCVDSGDPVPDELSTQQEIVSWMEEQFA